MLNADLKENKKTTTFCRGEMLKLFFSRCAKSGNLRKIWFLFLNDTLTSTLILFRAIGEGHDLDFMNCGFVYKQT
jgi:hypothetical protein